MFGGGGGAPQVVYRDAPQVQQPPVPPLPAPPPPTPMNDGVAPAQDLATLDNNKNLKGTSIFKINSDSTGQNDYTDQGIDSGLSYFGN
ncbi:MAG: hypothetical protein EBU90_06880 [Proteobacteria bacterium]|nr:hypothetical protein [Pseudomonadota bacterium]NBP14028.1 hypothetical protein [bacterium]